MEFDILEWIGKAETIAVGNSIKEIHRLPKIDQGRGRWKKRKGVARIRFPDGSIEVAELHWYEMHGVGKCKMKIKRSISRK